MTPSKSFCVVHAAENIKGGVGTYLRDLVVAQRRSFGAGSVVVVVPRSQSDVLASPPGVEVLTFNDSGPRWLNTLKLAARMGSVMAGRNVSVVHLHSTFAGLALRPLMGWMPEQRQYRPAVVYCAHGWSFDRQASSASKLVATALEKRLAPACDAIVCISAHEVRLARRAGIPGGMLTHISNGIPLRPPVARAAAQPHWPEGKRRLLFVGRFDRQKGVDILLDALRELGDSAFAHIVGSAVLGDGATLDVPDNAHLAGWLSGPELAAYYDAAEVLIAPSRWEGFGLTAVEAMRAGLPVIAARVGGLAEVVEHGVTGLLVEPNSSGALVEAIRGTRTASLRAMGAAGRKRFVEHFTLDRMHGQLTALYQDLCDQKAAARELALPPRMARALPEGSYDV